MAGTNKQDSSMEARKTEALTHMGQASGPMTTQQMAEALGVSKDAATRTLKSLEKDGRIVREDVAAGNPAQWKASTRGHRVQSRDPDLETFKPLRPNTRRGTVAQMALEGAEVEAIADAIGRSRNWVVSEVSALSSERGIGFEYTGDTVTLRLPEGVASPFEWPSFED